MTTLTELHIATGTLALFAGAGSLIFRKGRQWHRLSGHMFFATMILMSASSVYLAIEKSEPDNIVVGLITLYLVTMAWWAVRGSGSRHLADALLLVLACTIIGTAMAFGLEAVRSETGLKNGIPAANFFFSAGIVGLFVVSDIRLMIRGGVFGQARLRRHLWRMCLAMFITTLSFFFGQAQVLPDALVATRLHLLPIICVVGVTVYWLFRFRPKDLVIEDRWS